MYFEGIRDLTIEESLFVRIEDSQAVEGGCMYLKNVYNLNVRKCEFAGQNSVIRGGAIFAKKDGAGYFG